MTKAELIAKLTDLPDDAEILVYDRDGRQMPLNNVDKVRGVVCRSRYDAWFEERPRSPQGKDAALLWSD